MVLLIKEDEVCSQYSGIDNEGKSVMGILKYKSKNKRYEIDNILKWYVNSGMTLEESVKCPLAYSMVIIILIYFHEILIKIKNCYRLTTVW